LHWGWIDDGRFKGGHITRQYGRPMHGVHAMQLEMCWLLGARASVTGP